MPPTIDKIIVANRSGMTAKYGAAGAAKIDKSLQRMIASDKARGLLTKIVEIDDGAQMAGIGGTPIVNGSDERGTKNAVDAIDAHFGPDYILLLDGPDVIPHIALSQIPGLVDSDQTIDSDLPYACAGAFARKASSYLAVTRVVGRLPMASGHQDSAVFVDLIDRCASHTSRAPANFSPFFAISADVWRQSTQLSLNAVFGGNTGLNLSPKAGHNTIDPSLQRLSHFVNCHGGRGDPKFYGQKGNGFPTAMESLLVAPNIREGTVAAVECCYGAELYNHTLIGNAQPICMSYLLNGAIAFLGSTTIAYGPAATNGQADLIAQYFLDEVLKGSSTGRAMLQARQRFIHSQSMASPANLKTLAQFVLYGDPSLVPVDVPKALGFDDETAAAGVVDRKSQRKSRRAGLKGDGLALASAAAFPAQEVDNSSAGVRRAKAIAKDRGFSVEPVVLSVSGGAKFREVAKSLGREQRVVVVTERRIENANFAEILPFYRMLVAHILGDGITAVEEIESR